MKKKDCLKLIGLSIDSANNNLDNYTDTEMQISYLKNVASSAVEVYDDTSAIIFG